MSDRSIELHIHEQLKTNDVSLVADDLLKTWLRGELSPDDQICVGNFLIHAGYLTTLKSHYLRLLTQDKFISWVPLFEYFLRVGVPVLDDILEQIIVGMTEQNNLDELIQSRNFAYSHERLKPIYQKLLEDKVQKLLSKKKDLLEKLQRAVNDRLEEEVQKISTELKTSFPTDEHIQDLAADLDIARIKNLLKKKEREFAEKIDWSMPDDLAAERKQLVETCLALATATPDQAYDLSILLAQVDAFNEALTCLALAPDSLAKDWLRMDLLIRSKNFIAALNDSLEIEKKYSKNPETIFATLLLRSQALYGLGEKDKAVEIVTKIVEIQPKNQNARMLLHQWRSI